jgi:hypothetical protein
MNHVGGEVAEGTLDRLAGPGQTGEVADGVISPDRADQSTGVVQISRPSLDGGCNAGCITPDRRDDLVADSNARETALPM